MSPGWKGRDWGGWDIPGGCVGAPGGEHRELLSELLCKPSVPALPGHGSCSLGCFWDGSGLCPGRSISGGPFRAAPGRGAAGSPRSVSIPAPPGHPSARPGLCLAAACHGQDTEAQPLPCRHQGQEGLVPSLGLGLLPPRVPGRLGHTEGAPRNIPGREQESPRAPCSPGLGPHREFGL